MKACLYVCSLALNIEVMNIYCPNSAVFILLESFDNDNDAKEFVQAKIESLVAQNEAKHGPEGTVNIFNWWLCLGIKSCICIPSPYPSGQAATGPRQPV